MEMCSPLPRASNRRTVRPRILLASIASLLSVHTALAADAGFSSGAFTGDADSGVSSAKTYTAIANIVGGNVTVNGATFIGGGTSGTGWSLAGAGNNFGGGGIHQALGGDRSTVIDAVAGAAGGRLPSTTALSLTNSGATLDLSANAQTVGSLAGAVGTSVLNGGSFTAGGDGSSTAFGGGGGGFAEYTLTGSVTLAATSNIGGNNLNNLRAAGAITGPGGLTKGAGRVDENNTLVLANPANDYAGNTVVSNGTLKAAASEVIPHGAGKGGVTVNSGATLDLGGFSETINSLSGSGVVTSTASVGTPVVFNSDAGAGISAATSPARSL